MYGSFNCIMFDHATVTAKVMVRKNKFVYDTAFDGNEILYKCSIWGPTCDSIDCVTPSALLPELDVGDWLVFENMGAYTLCAASQL